MHDSVSEPSYAMPIYIRVSFSYFFWQTVCGFADDLKISYNRVDGFVV